MGEKRGKRRRFWAAVILAAAAAAAALWAGRIWAGQRTVRQLTAAMRQLAEKDGETVRLSQVTPFSWDEVYSFDPYMSGEEMETAMGIEAGNLPETVSEGMEQLIFLDGGRVVCAAAGYGEALGWRVDLGEGESGRGYRRVDSGDDQMLVEVREGIPCLTYRACRFTGTVTEVFEGGAVAVTGELEGYPNGAAVEVSLDTDQWNRAEPGDEVEVVCGRMMKETSPLQITDQRAAELKKLPEDSVDFREFNFGHRTAAVRINSGHTGKYVWVTDEEEIGKILDFLHTVRISGRGSSKGYYGWSYGIDLYGPDREKSVWHLAFGDGEEVFYGKHETDQGYSSRYVLDSPGLEEVKGFFQGYLSLNSEP